MSAHPETGPSMETLASRLSTTRLEAFSDGVFAIAITLLVLDIGIGIGARDDLLQALLDEWPAYLSYLTSFAAIGVIWVLHHWIIGSLRQIDINILRLNLVLLLVVAFLPFPTRLLGEFLGEDDPERVAVVFYGLSLLATKGALTALWRYAINRPALLKDDVSEREMTEIGRLLAPDLPLMAAATVLAVFLPQVAAGLLCVISVASLARSR